MTVLLKFDPRSLTYTELSPDQQRKGDNLFTYLYRVGAGMTSYIPPGNGNEELLDPRRGFDGGVRDFDPAKPAFSQPHDEAYAAPS